MAVLVMVGLLLARLPDLLRPTPSGGDFTLQGGDGPVSLHDFTSRWVVLYFGFTTCPDYCPAALARWASLYQQLEVDEQARLQVLFISLDGERDSPQQTADYAAYFHPAFVGASGDEAAIAAVATAYGVRYERVVIDSALEYTIDHSTYSYLIDPQGALVEMFPDGMTVEEKTRRLRLRLQTID